MTKIEQTDFENAAKFKAAIEALLTGKEVTRDYTDKDGQSRSKILIKNNRLYVGNNYSISISTDKNTGKMYFAIEYFGVEDRIRLATDKKNNESIKL